MAKKRTKAQAPKKEFNSDPFSNLKGFAVSTPESKAPQMTKQKQPTEKVVGSFADEMQMLGVRKLNDDGDSETEWVEDSPSISTLSANEDATDEEIFLTAMGDLSVNFRDDFPEDNLQSTAQQRRIKQLKRGKLSPEASLDLHGCQRSDVAQKLIYFLDDSLHQGYQTVLVITGKGLHSEDGTPVLRQEVERFLLCGGEKYVLEWGRAPKQYGGEGAIILFLRKMKKI